MYKKCTPECGVLDVNKTVEWYKDNLGFELITSVPQSGKYEWALMKKDSVEIMFQTQKSLSEELPSLKENPSPGQMILYIGVENIEKIYADLKDKIKIIKELHKTFYESKEFAIRDCNSFTVLFAERN